VHINPAGASFTLTAPAGAFADFLLAWEDSFISWTYNPFLISRTYDPFLYSKEVWRLTFTQTNIVLTRVNSWGWHWHEVYVANQYSVKTLIWTWNKPGPKHNSYTVPWFATTVWIESQVFAMNAEATFTKVCRWS